MSKSPEMSSSSDLALLASLVPDMNEEERLRLLSAVGTKFFGTVLNYISFDGKCSSSTIQYWTALSKKEPAAVSDALKR